MYAPHFGLTERPFSLAPDPRYFYLSDAHREALAHLLYGIGEGGSFVQLTGEVGTGKTTVCRTLLEQLPADVDVAMIFNPRLTSVELLAAVCDELRIAYPAGTTSPKVLVDALSQALLDAHGRGRRTVLIIDEAQNLSPAVLEEIRLLTNLETTREKLLQVILIGQPELADILARPELRQLAQRVTARYHLRPFTEEESCAYVQHRLEVAGRQKPIFDRAALRLAHHLAGGVPRLLNTVCDRALLGAYAVGQDRVTAAIVRRAGREVLGGSPRSRRRIVATATVTALVAAGVAFALLGSAGLALIGIPIPGSRAADSIPAPPVAQAVLEQPAEPTLAEILTTPSVSTDKATAFANLYALWHLDVRPNVTNLGCEYGHQAGFRCVLRAGTWTVLRRFSLPAILPLRARGGEEQYVVLTDLDGERATLQIGERRLVVPTLEIERFWDGPFVMIWRPPVVGSIPLAPGMRGKDVLWLRQRLAEIAGQPVSAGASQVYDEDLTRQVAAFQQAESLTPDGIAGEETLVRLAAMMPGSKAPALVSGGRR
jgi:general secretion pathway protein A